MSVDPLATLKILEIYGCTPVIITTVVGYDYILTFQREIDAVWCRPWTWVSTLFLIIRYIGLCWAVTLGLTGSIALPGPIDAYVPCLVMRCYINDDRAGTALVAIGDWGYMVFLAAADLVMILRVVAMWNQSKIILGVLLLLYVPQMVVTIVWDAFYENPGTTLAVSTYEVFNYKVCTYASTIAPPSTYRAIPRFVLGSVLLILALIPTLRQSVEMYKLTKRWEINRTMQLLVREGAVYFVVNLLYNIINAIQLPIVDLMMFLDTSGYALTCTVVPRFIISIRELYDRDVRERWRAIDTGFGRCTTQSEGVSTTVMGEVESRADDVEEVELENVQDDVWRV